MDSNKAGYQVIKENITMEGKNTTVNSEYTPLQVIANAITAKQSKPCKVIRQKAYSKRECIKHMAH